MRVPWWRLPGCGVLVLARGVPCRVVREQASAGWWVCLRAVACGCVRWLGLFLVHAACLVCVVCGLVGGWWLCVENCIVDASIFVVWSSV